MGTRCVRARAHGCERVDPYISHYIPHTTNLTHTHAHTHLRTHTHTHPNTHTHTHTHVHTPTQTYPHTHPHPPTGLVSARWAPPRHWQDYVSLGDLGGACVHGCVSAGVRVCMCARVFAWGFPSSSVVCVFRCVCTCMRSLACALARLLVLACVEDL